MSKMTSKSGHRARIIDNDKSVCTITPAGLSARPPARFANLRINLKDSEGT